MQVLFLSMVKSNLEDASLTWMRSSTVSRWGKVSTSIWNKSYLKRQQKTNSALSFACLVSMQNIQNFHKTISPNKLRSNLLNHLLKATK